MSITHWHSSSHKHHNTRRATRSYRCPSRATVSYLHQLILGFLRTKSMPFQSEIFHFPNMPLSHNSLAAVCLLTKLCLLRPVICLHSSKESSLSVSGNIYSHSFVTIDMHSTPSAFRMNTLQQWTASQGSDNSEVNSNVLTVHFYLVGRGSLDCRLTHYKVINIGITLPPIAVTICVASSATSSLRSSIMKILSVCSDLNGGGGAFASCVTYILKYSN